MSQHEDYPIITDKDGVERYKANPIVRFLLDAGPFDMNTLALIPFHEEDAS